MNARNGAMLEFMGTEATLYLDRGRLEVIPERKRDARNSNAQLPTEPEMQWILGTGPRGADFLRPAGRAKFSTSATGWNACAAATLREHPWRQALAPRPPRTWPTSHCARTASRIGRPRCPSMKAEGMKGEV